VAKPAFQGPLPVRNQHPAQLTVMHMPPARAAVLGPEGVQVRVDAAYSSLFLFGQTGNRSWIMDGEYLRVGTGLRWGLGDGFEFAAELPFAHTSGGFLDSFLIDYHEAFGFPDQDRENFPKNEYDIEARQGSQTVWQVQRESIELLDVPLRLTKEVIAPGPERVGVAVRGGIELPTGNDERGYGSGKVEPSVGGLLEYDALGVSFTGHADYTWAGTPSPAKRSGLTFADVTALGVGAELPLANALHAFVQLEWETSTLRNFGLSVTDHDQLLLWVGGRWSASRTIGLEIGLGEDLASLVSPDFTAWFGMVWSPAAVGRP
jgi:hypothetical protein